MVTAVAPMPMREHGLDTLSAGEFRVSSFCPKRGLGGRGAGKGAKGHCVRFSAPLQSSILNLPTQPVARQVAKFAKLAKQRKELHFASLLAFVTLCELFWFFHTFLTLFPDGLFSTQGVPRQPLS